MEEGRALVVEDSVVAGADDSSPATPLLVVSTTVALCGSFCYGSAAAYSSPAESGIMKDLGLSSSQYSVFSSILTIGGILGALINGRAADRFGRRATMWLSDIFCIAGWLAIAFAKNALLLDLGRLSLGFGVGLICYVVPVYIAEITPTNLRGAFTVSVQLMACFGFALMYFTGTIFSWRVLALIGVVPGVLQIIGLLFIPESPRWLAKIGKEKEFEDALQLLRGNNTNISREAYVIRDYIDKLEYCSQFRFLDLFQRRHARSLLVGVGLMMLQQFGGVGAFESYASSIFESAGFSSSVGTRAVAIIMIPSTVVGVFLTDKCGRRPLLMVSAGGMCLCTFLMGLTFSLQGLQIWEEVTPILIFIFDLGLVITYSIGMGGIPWVIMSEIFPMNVKGSAGSIVTLTNWSCSWIVIFTYNFMAHWSLAGTFFIYSVFWGLTVMFVVNVVPETRGRSLEQIQALLTNLFE